jgi:hypothetical protein
MNDDPVRDALADLAPLAPADDAAFSGVRRAVTRRRRRRTAGRVAAAVVAVGLIAGGSLAAAGLQEDEGGLSTRRPTERVSLGDMTLELPEDWAITSRDPSADHMCIGPIGYPVRGDCAGLDLYHGDPLPGHEMEEYQDHGQWSWYHQTDVAQCPNRPQGPGEPIDAVEPNDEDGYDPIDTGERDVGGRTAVYDQWAARCDRSGFEFSPRAWHLAEDQILIVDVLGHPETEEILASVRWGS